MVLTRGFVERAGVLIQPKGGRIRIKGPGLRGLAFEKPRGILSYCKTGQIPSCYWGRAGLSQSAVATACFLRLVPVICPRERPLELAFWHIDRERWEHRR